jgi:general secretion pathway protein G
MLSGSCNTVTGRRDGFTIIELMVVLAVLALLVSVVTPRFIRHVEKARESVLRQNLFVLRDAIDKYSADNGRYPASLQVLADTKYIRRVPEDPITGRNDSWVLVMPSSQSQQGIFDIRSGATGSAQDGTAYASW